MNFFSWIRDGVRQAVLMGVSDAVENLGTPSEHDEMPQRLLEVIRNGGPNTVAGPPRLTDRSQRKKLGRTLQEIQASTAKTT